MKSKLHLRNVTLIDEGLKNDNVCTLLTNFTKKKFLDVTVYNRCIFKSHFLHSTNYSRITRIDDSVVKLSNGYAFQIKYIIKADDDCFIYGFNY